MDNNSTLEALQSKVSTLETELGYLNQVLIACGFPEGIATLKLAAEEMLKTLA